MWHEFAGNMKTEKLENFFCFLVFCAYICSGIKPEFSMTQREKIVRHVSQMLSSLGIKSVRMDDVANSLGMSKRTLYEMFGDKEELLYESIMYRDEQFRHEMMRKTAECDNMLEVLLTCVRELNSGVTRWSDTEKRMISNLKKFYPHIFEKVMHDHAEYALTGLRDALDKCRADGYLDPNADTELLTRLFFMTMGTIMCGNDIVLPEGITREIACSAMLVNFLRGLCSVKGVGIIDEILAREKTLKPVGGGTE